MFDEHIAQENLGLLPVIDIWGFHLSGYSLFMMLALAAAFVCFKLTASQTGKENGHIRALIIVFALLGGIVGAKIPILIYNYKLLFSYPQNIDLLLSGRTIVGGLIGGYLAVYFVKRKLDIRAKTGNDIAAPAALGMAVGRIGCLLGGCCYGIESPEFLGINLGDGIYRYPTQIYEIIFDLGLFILFLYMKKTRDLEPGILFRYLLNSYLIFRAVLEFIRVTDLMFWGISYYQVLCIICLVFINRIWMTDKLKLITERIQQRKALGERKIL
ncbi:MAG: prolipoprotein diacylglyceryl transferase [Saccharofermentanales bacterium]